MASNIPANRPASALATMAATIVALSLAPGAPAFARGAPAQASEVARLTAQARRAELDGADSQARTLAARAFELGRERLGEADRATLEAGAILGRYLPSGAEAQALLGRLSAVAAESLGPLDPQSLELRRRFALSLETPPDDEKRGDRTPRLDRLQALLTSLSVDVRGVSGPLAVATARAELDLGQFLASRNDGTTCEYTSDSIARFQAALSARPDEALTGDWRARPVEDVFLLNIRGFISEAYGKLASCAELTDRPDDMKRYGALEERFMLEQLEDLRRLAGPADGLTLTMAAGIADWYDAHDRPAEARALAARVVADAARAHRGDTPEVIRLELAHMDCSGPRGACSAEQHRRIGELSQIAIGFGRDRRPDGLDLYGYAFLGDAFRGIDAGAWLDTADAVYARSTALRLKLQGPAEARSAAALQYQFRRDTPRFAAAALEPARLMAAAERARTTGRGASSASSSRAGDTARRTRETWLTLADAAWTAGGRAEPAATGRGRGGPLGQEAYRALQAALSGTVNRALALSAAQRAADARGGDLGALARRRTELADAWEGLTADLVTAGASGRDTAALRRRQDEAAREAAAIDAQLRARFPAYYSLLDPEPVSLKATQALLGTDEAVLILTPGRDGGGVHVIAVSADGFIWRRSEVDGYKLAGQADHLLWLAGADIQVSPALEQRWLREAGPGVPFDRRLAHQLFLQLVAPAQPVLEHKRHVFVVAGGWISRMPLGILVASPPFGKDDDPAALRSTDWLADRYALSLQPSVRALQVLRAGRRAAVRQQPLVGFGDPQLGGGAVRRGGRAQRSPPAQAVFVKGPDSTPTGLANVQVLRRLSRLPGTATELRNMRDLLQAPESALFLGERATEAQVKDADLSHVRVLAFATHGLLAGDLGGDSEPGLVLTPPETASARDDGLLAASEVAALNLDADWVILSACNTAAGDGSSDAPGLSGLARAFFHAGARSLLVSHWPVRDDVASRITVETLRLARENPALSRDQALQLAMRHIRDDPVADAAGDTWAHPNAWAPFSLVGDGSER